MKTFAWLLLLTGVFLSACTTQKQATSYTTDEVYGNPSQDLQLVAQENSGKKVKNNEVITAPDRSSSERPASSTWKDDYTDYSNASAGSRGNYADSAKGNHDNYGGGGSSSGSSPNFNLSLGFGAGYGYYGPSFGFGWGYPMNSWDLYFGWGYPPYWGSYGWGYPYYYGYPYYPNWYYPPYYDCRCCGYYPVASAYSTYYGPRRSLYRTDGGYKAGNYRITNTGSGTQTPNNRVQSPPDSRTINNRTAGNSITYSRPVTQERYRYTRPDRIQQPLNQRTTGNYQRYDGKPQVTQPNPRYVRPENGGIQRSGETQSYSSPVYRSPKTSQEYLAPRVQNNVNNRSTDVNHTARSGSQYTSPSRSESREIFTNPRRSSENNYNFTSPQRSSPSPNYSAPVRSSGSYSSPSNSGSYSSPSRSGGGGTSSPSSGGGSGRRR